MTDDLETRMTMSDLECRAQLAYCYCELDTNHDGPHVCECGGSWTATGDIFAFPEGRTAEEAALVVVDALGFSDYDEYDDDDE